MSMQKYQCQGCGRIITYDDRKFEDGTPCKKCGEELVLEEDSEYEEQDDDEESEDTYNLDWKCDNCDESVNEDIPKGTRAKDFFSTRKCEECGCLLAEVKE